MAGAVDFILKLAISIPALATDAFLLVLEFIPMLVSAFTYLFSAFSPFDPATTYSNLLRSSDYPCEE
jgi:hypothetical protein